MAFNAVTGQFLAEHLGGRFQPDGGDVSASSAQLRDTGDLAIEGVTAWTPPAPEEVEHKEAAGKLSLESLTPDQRAQIEEFLKNVDTIPVDQLAMMKTLLEAQRPQVPASDLPVFTFILQIIDEKLTAERG